MLVVKSGSAVHAGEPFLARCKDPNKKAARSHPPPRKPGVGSAQTVPTPTAAACSLQDVGLDADRAREKPVAAAPSAPKAAAAPARSGSIPSVLDDNLNAKGITEEDGEYGGGEAAVPDGVAVSRVANGDHSGEAPLDQAADKLVALGSSGTGPESRPLVTMNVGDPLRDLLFLSNIPSDMTYDRLQDLVEPFGDVCILNWDANEPSVAEVIYEDPASAEEALTFLSDSLLGGPVDEQPLRAELRSRDHGTQLFVGDLTPDVTEAMLEAAFSELVQTPVTANLKRDPGTFSPVGYGFLTFEDEFTASRALIEGHRMSVGNARVRVGRAERNTFLYVSDLSRDVTMPELKQVFGRFGSIVEEDTVIVHRSYAFIRYRNRDAAESAKRTLDKTSLRGRMTVRYAEAEPIKSTVQVQFHSSVPRPPSSLKDLLHSTFSKYGNCSIDVPRLANGTWRKTAFVQYHAADPISAALAATEAVQNVKFVSTIPVLCQFGRELIPRVSPKGPPKRGPAGGDDRCDREHHSRHVNAGNRTFAGSSTSPKFRSREAGVEYGAPLSAKFDPRRPTQRGGHKWCGQVSEDERSTSDTNAHFCGTSNGGSNRHDACKSGTTCTPREHGGGGFQHGDHHQPRLQQHLRRGSAMMGQSSCDGGDLGSPSGRGGGDVAYMPVFMPVPSMGGNPYALSSMPGLLTESEFAAAAAGFVAPQYPASMSPIMYPVQGPSPPHGYGMPMASMASMASMAPMAPMAPMTPMAPMPPMAMMNMGGHRYDDDPRPTDMFSS